MTSHQHFSFPVPEADHYPTIPPMATETTITCKHEYTHVTETARFHDGWNEQERKWLIVYCKRCGEITSKCRL